jgi:Site-specific recombinase XerD
MVAGHLQEKRGYYHIVLTYLDTNGKRCWKWIATGLLTKGNKKKAETLLMEARRDYVPGLDKQIDRDMLFADFLEDWLEVVKPTIRLSTFASYSSMTKSPIGPYFRSTKATLSGLQPWDIQSFYNKELKRVKANTVIHYHAVIRKALKYAVKIDLIEKNPADKVERPKIDRFVGSFYDSDEINKMFEVAKGTRLELPVMFGAFYGLRRSEVLGLKWDAIDFKSDTITIRHTVTSCNIDGKHMLVASDNTKTKSSMRTLPLVPAFKEKLLAVRAEQEHNRKLCGRAYNKEYQGYICINEIGEIIKPTYITSEFPQLLERNGLRKIRYHDLRHSCASLLLANGVPMKQIQDWLGHSDFSTTANIYAHLDYNSKLSSASALQNGLNL